MNLKFNQIFISRMVAYPSYIMDSLGSAHILLSNVLLLNLTLDQFPEAYRVPAMPVSLACVDKFSPDPEILLC